MPFTTRDLASLGRNAVVRWVFAFVGFNVALFAFVFFALWATGSFEDWTMGSGGWVAMCVGIVFTSALGVGLMALVFYSDRRGYDDSAGRIFRDDH